MLRICMIYACLMVSVSTLNGMNTTMQEQIRQDLSQTCALIKSFNPDQLDGYLLMKPCMPNVPMDIKLNTFVLSYLLYRPLLHLYLTRLTDEEIEHYSNLGDGHFKQSLTSAQKEEIINLRKRIIAQGNCTRA